MGIETGLASAKALIDIWSKWKEARSDDDQAALEKSFHDMVANLHDKIIVLQQQLLTMQSEQLKMAEKYRQLEQEKLDIEQRSRELDRYALVEISPGAEVYICKLKDAFVTPENPAHYICPNCVADKRKSILQKVPTSGPNYACRHCDAHFAEPSKKAWRTVYR